ncbi:MAG TPA: ParB/RepB/Spo0J family partition protein [Candidatus Binatia bacterium]|nr:ParB/RepB/Spo0J family partition protein [Candidatus Binatia bacterium]
MSTAAAQQVTPYLVEMVQLDTRIVESATNPWHGREDVTELAEDIKANGIEQPVLLRPIGEGKLEIVFGHRRIRAARKAGLTAVPARIRELTDVEALERQIAENDHRENVDQIDRAESVRRLHTQHGLTVDDIAARLKKSRASIYGYLKLADVIDDAKEAVWSGKTTASHVLEIARVVDKGAQFEALQFALKPNYNNDLPSVRDLRSHVRSFYGGDLDGVPWDLNDAELVAVAGACNACAKRSDTQARLLATDDDKRGFCMDRQCFAGKLKAWHQQELLRLKGLGCRMLSNEHLGEIMSYGRARDPYWDLDSWPILIGIDHARAPKDFSRDIEQLGKKVYRYLHVGLDDDGEVVVLLHKQDTGALQNLASKAGLPLRSEPALITGEDRQTSDNSDDQEGDDQEGFGDQDSEAPSSSINAWTDALFAAGIRKARTIVSAMVHDRCFWKPLAALILSETYNYNDELLCELAEDYGLTWNDDTRDQDVALSHMTQWVDTASEGDIAAMIFTLKMCGGADWSVVLDAMTRLGIERAELEAELQQQADVADDSIDHEEGNESVDDGQELTSSHDEHDEQDEDE